jgi:cell division protein FtsQ
VAKNSSNSRVAALAVEGDEELDDFYRPEVPARPRAATRASKRPVRQASSSSTRDFADSATRLRAGQYDDPYDDPDFLPDPLHADEEDRVFLRSRRRVPVRKSAWLSTRWGKIGLALCVLAVVGVLTTVFLLVRNFFLTDPRFRVDTASSIQLVGNSEINRTELLSVFGADVGHNIFRVPLAQRRAALQALPWVEHATVMRLLPNQLRVAIVERVPVAFVRTGNRIQLVDATGVLLTMPPAMLAARHYSFPVVIGINADDPIETRAERMQLYQKFIRELNSPAPAADKSTPAKTIADVSQQLSEVDVSDTEDVRARMPSAGADILVHFGDEDFANRYKSYQQHLAQWRQQYPHLAAIDLRYDRQTVLEMDKSATTTPADAVASATPALVPVIRKTAVRKPAAKTVVNRNSPRKPAAAKAPSRQLPAKKPATAMKSSAYVEPFDVKGRN